MAVATVFDDLDDSPASPRAGRAVFDDMAPSAPAARVRTVFDDLPDSPPQIAAPVRSSARTAPAAAQLAAPARTVFDDLDDTPPAAAFAGQATVFDDLDPAPPMPNPAEGIIARAPGLNEDGKQALRQRYAPVAPPPDPRAPLEAAAVRYGMDPQQAKTALLTPRNLMQQYLRGMPQVPSGTDDEQQAGAVARTQWLRDNPPPPEFLNDPWFMQQYRGTAAHVPVKTTAFQEVGQATDRFAAQAASTSAGIVDSLAGLEIAEPNLMGFETPATLKARETDHKEYNQQQHAAARKLASDVRGYAQEKQEKLMEPGTTGAKVVATGTEVTGAVAPAIVAGALGGPVAATGVAGTMALGSVREDVYTSLVAKGYPDEEAHRLADIAGKGAGAVGLATGNLLGRAPVAKSIAGKIVEQTAEGTAYGGLQAAAEEKIRSAATGDKPDWLRVPTEAGIGGSISFALSALGTLFSRGKARVRPEVRQQFEERVRTAQTPAEVQKAVDEASDVQKAIEEAMDAEDAPRPAQPAPYAPGTTRPPGLVLDPPKTTPVAPVAAAKAVSAPDTEEQFVDGILAHVRGVADSDKLKAMEADARALYRKHHPAGEVVAAEGPAEAPAPVNPAAAAELASNRADMESLAREQQVDAARQQDRQREAAEIAEENQTVERRARAVGYGSEDLRRMSNRQLQRVAQDLGVTFDARATGIGRILDAQQQAKLEQTTTSELYWMVKNRGLRAGTRRQNIEALLAAEREPVPQPTATSPQQPIAPAQQNGPDISPVSTDAGSQVGLPSPGVQGVRAVKTVTVGAPQVKKKPGQPGKTQFTRAAIEQRLIDYHEESGAGYTAADDQQLNNISSGNALTFLNRLPGEVRHHIENNPAAKRLFRVTSDPTQAGGDDAFGELGDRYWTLVDKIAGSSIKAAKETARKHGDPVIRFWAQVHDSIPEKRYTVDPETGKRKLKFDDRKPQIGIDPHALDVGQEFELNGEKFQVVEDEDGYRILKDGEDFDPVPVDAFKPGDKVPVDKGTLKEATEPEVPDGDPFADLPIDPALEARAATSEPAGTGTETAAPPAPPQRRQRTRDERLDRIFEILNRDDVGRDYRNRLEQYASRLMTDEEAGAVEIDVPSAAPATPAEPAKPTFFNADEAGASRTGSGLFGQDVADAATGKQTGALFHQPVDVPRPSRDGVDAKFAGKFDEAATPTMFEGPARDARTPQPPQTPGTGETPAPRARQPAQATPATPPAPRPPTQADPVAPRLRKSADGLQKHIDDKRRPMTQNPTPKRMREYNSRRHDANNLERTQRGLRAIADAREAGTLPPILGDVKSPAQVAPLVRKGLENGGYYDVIPSQKYADSTPKGRALQELIDNVRSPEQRAADADRARADRVRELEQRVQFSDIEGFFPTPRPVIDRMIEAAGIEPGMKVLEPSAGKGDIVDALADRGVDVEAVEVRPALRDLLEAKGHKLVGGDFMETSPAEGGGYDRVLMNPPFERGQDIDHVRHAFEQLKPGGRLVAVMSAGSFQRTRGKETAFRAWLDDVGGTAEDLPEGSFTGAGAFRQTGTATKMVVIDKPAVRNSVDSGGPRANTAGDERSGSQASPIQARPAGPEAGGEGDSPTLSERHRRHLADAVTRILPGASAEVSPTGLTIQFPHGRTKSVRIVSEAEIDAAWRESNIGESLVAHKGGRWFLGEDGERFQVPATEREWNQLTTARQQYIARQFTAEGIANEREILLSSRQATARVLREEVFHSVFHEDLNDSERAAILAEFKTEERAYVVFKNLSKKPAPKESVGKGLLRSIATGELHKSLPPHAGGQAGDTTPDQGSQARPVERGRLDRAEQWARDQLTAIDQGTAEAMKGLTPAQRRLRGTAGALDPQRLVLYGVIGAVKIGKGVKRFADWTKAMADDLGEAFARLTNGDKATLWREARRVQRMADKERAEYLADRWTIPASETAGQTTRRLTGQVRTARAVSEVQALAAKLRAHARGAREGYRLGKAEMQGFKKELARTIRDTLPPELHGRFLRDIARIQTPAEMRLALHKASRMLADHELREAFKSIENLTGKSAFIDLMRPKKIRTPEVTEAEAAERLGARMVDRLKKKESGENVRRVEIKKLPEPQRTEVRKLISQAAALRARMLELRDSGTVEEKQEVADAFERLERDIRQIIADVENTREIRIGGRMVTRDALVNEVVAKIDPAGKAASDTTISSEAPRDVGLLRRIVRGHDSIETIAANLFGKESDAYKLAVEQVRRGQEAYHDERRDFHRHMDKAFDAAGIPAQSKKLNDWINKTETVELPTAGKATLTRNEMVGLVASAGDPETAGLIERGVGWTFRNRPRDNPFKLTAADIDAIRSTLTDGERGLVDAFKTYNRDKITARAMDAKLELSGHAPDPHEGYFPRARNRKQLEDAGLPEGWQGVRRKALENISSMRERAPDLLTPLFVPEFVQDVQNYIEDTGRLLHLAGPVRSVAAVLEHPRVTQAVQKSLGESMNTRLQHFLEETLMVRLAPATDMPGKVMTLLTRNIARTWLQMNPSPVLKNISGGVASLLPEFDTRDLVPAVAKAFSRQSYREMIDASGVAWDRYEGGGLYGQFSPITEKRVETLAQMTFAEAVKARKPGAAVDALPFMRWADSVPLTVAWEAAKHQVERIIPGANEATKRREALAAFHDAIYATQNGNSSTEISGIGSLAKRGSIIAQAATLFQSDANKKLNMLRRLGSETDPVKRRKTIAAVALNVGLASLVSFGLKRTAEGIGRAAGGAEPDEEELEKMWRGLGWDALANLLGISYVGAIGSDLLRTGMTSGQSTPAIQTPAGQAVNDVFRDLSRLVAAIAKLAQQHPDERDWSILAKSTEGTLLSVNTLGGNPLVPLYRLARRAVKAGTYTPDDPRIVQNRAAEKNIEARTKQVRRSVPGLEALMAERRELDRKGGLGDAHLNATERHRKHYLDGAARVFDRHMDAIRLADLEGDQDRAARAEASLRQAIGDADRLAFEAELSELRKLKDNFDHAKRERDWTTVRELSRTSRGWGRLRMLEDRDRLLKLYEQQVRDGKLTLAEAEKRTNGLLRGVAKKAG